MHIHVEGLAVSVARQRHDDPNVQKNTMAWRENLVGLLVLSTLLFLPMSVWASVSNEGSILVHGQPRTFIVYSPDDRAGVASLPIFIVLHGGLGNGRYAANQTGLMNYVDREKFIAVFPDGKDTHWNDGRSTTASGPDDVLFLRELIASVVQKSAGDPNRVFIAGISNGGMMAQRMACDASNAVTAIGAVAANMPADLVNHCQPSRAVPVVLFNGTSDRIMPWSGGSIATSRVFNTPGGKVLSTMDTFDFWSRLDGCSTKTVETVPSTHVERQTSKGCRSGSEVTLYAIQDGGHGWPGRVSQSPFERAIAGYVTTEINATVILIQFFRQYGL
jgi:polyhydroxybutyrate depolymerase